MKQKGLAHLLPKKRMDDILKVQ